MTDRVLWQTNDALSEGNLATVAARANQTDYVERGLKLVPDWSAGTLSVGAGYAVVRSDARAYFVFPDRHTGISLPNDDGANYVSLHLLTDDAGDVGQDRLEYHVDATDDPPADPHLKIGIVDTGAESVTRLNREPSADFDAVEAAAATLRQVYLGASDDATATPEGATRPLTTNGHRTYRVPGDYPSVQAAANDFPWLIRHNVAYEIEDGFYDEDVVWPSAILRHVKQDGGERTSVFLRGDQSDPSNVRIGSLLFDNLVGYQIQARGIEVQRENPWTNERAAVEFYGCDGAALVDCAFAGGREGLVSYRSNVSVNGVDFGDGVLRDAMQVKHAGRIVEQLATDVPSEGRARRYAYRTEGGGHVLYADGSTLTADDRLHDPHGGIVQQIETGAVWTGPQSIPDYGGTRTMQPVGDGTIRPDARYLRLNGERDAANVLETITGGGPDGGPQRLLLESGAFNPTVAHGTGNIRLSGGEDKTLEQNDTLELVYDGTNWKQVSYSGNP